MISKFSGKPRTDVYYRAIDGYVMGLGEAKREFRAQEAYSEGGFEYVE